MFLNIFARKILLFLSARALMDKNPRASAKELAAALGVHPFAAGKAMTQARFFRMEDLKQAHEMLFQFDRDAKRGGMEADLAVDLLTVRLC